MDLEWLHEMRDNDMRRQFDLGHGLEGAFGLDECDACMYHMMKSNEFFLTHESS